MSTKRNSASAPRLSAKAGERSPSPFASNQAGPYTSISKLPDLPVPVESPAQRKRTEIQELRTNVESLGTKAAASGDVGGLTVILHSISANGCDLINLRTKNGYNMLHYAVAYGQINAVKLLLEHGADPNCATEDSMLDTPLTLAVKYASKAKEGLDILDLLLKKGVNVNWQNSKGDTALMLATDMQDVAVFKVLINIEQIDIEKPNLKRDTPLIVAASHDNEEIISTLLVRKADIYAKNKLGCNAVHVACINGNKEMLQIILDNHSIEISRIQRERDLQGKTPLLLAKTASHNASILVEHLISTNADMKAADRHGNKLLHLYNQTDDADLSEMIIKKCPQLLEDTNHNSNCYKETPLHIATRLGYKDCAKLFMERCTDLLFAVDIHGFTPCMVAIATGQKDILKIMLDPDLNILEVTRKNSPFINIVKWAIENDHIALLQAIWEQDHQALVDQERLGLSTTLLHIAARVGAIESTKKLLAIPQTRALLNAEDEKKQLPIHIAAEKGHLQIVLLLCEAEIETNNICHINNGDHNGNTPLHCACSNGHIQIVKYLIQNGSNLDDRNALEYDAVACAAAKGYDNILQYLLSLGQPPNGTQKACPIILASAKGHIKCVKMLLNHKDVKVSMTNTAGYNCLAEAIRNGHKEITFAILSSKHWIEAMRMSTNDGITPMRLMIMSMPEAAEAVLDNSITSIAEEEHGHSNVSKIDYSYEFIEDFQDPQEECYYHLASFLTNKKHSLENDNIVIENINLTTPAQATEMNSVPNSNNDTYNESPHKPIKKNNNWGPKRFEKKNHVIKLMVDNKRIQLLQHPLVAELLKYKWRIFGYPYFFFHLLVFVIFLAFLTTFALLLPLPEHNEDCRRLQFIEGSDTTEMTMDDSLTNDINDNTTDELELEEGNRMITCPGLSDSRMSELGAISTVLLVLSIVGILIELVQLLYQKLQYFRNPHNYMEVTLFVIVFLFIRVDPDDCWCADSTLWQLGVAGCVLAWLNLVYILKRLPFTAIPINMMINVLSTFFSIVLLPILLIVTFALPFYMLLANPEMHTAFRQFPQSCVKTLVMITGEFEFDAIFLNNSSGAIPYPLTTYLLWIVFVILMPILFNNLLVGLAVGDIQKERDKAVLTKFYLQVDLALSVEESLTIIRRLSYKNNDKFYPTKAKPHQKFQKMFGTTFETRLEDIKTIERDKSFENHLTELPNMDEIKSLLEKQENDILKLKEKSEEQERLLQRILSSVENTNNGSSQVKDNNMKLKAKADSLSDSYNLTDDNVFPLLPQ